MKLPSIDGSRCYRNEAERRANVRSMARDRHPDSPYLAALLLAWSEAEAAANRKDLLPQNRAQADALATARMNEYLRVKALPIVFPYVVFAPTERSTDDRPEPRLGRIALACSPDR
ncbi:MAG: hypothetical protein JWN14_4473 [Chthonomonadales bacterium]|nr:hypothetical protein [Chthonomonadales bacterium]